MSVVEAIDLRELKELYRELILDHARKPRHFGKLAGATHTAEGINPLCGDKLRLYLLLDDEGVVRDARFEGSGCAISVASASLLTDTVIGMSGDEAQSWFRNVTAELTGTGRSDIELGKLRALQGVREFPSRVKCATLAWHALSNALEGRSDVATTE